MADAPAGWYPNPEDPSTERWWDGSQWHETTRPLPPSFPPPSPTAWAPSTGAMTKPDSYLVWSILVTLFCCLPFGIAAIVQAAKVDGLWSSGDYAGAHRASQQAKRWITWSVVLGLVVAVLYVAVIALGSAAEPEYQRIQLD